MGYETTRDMVLDALPKGGVGAEIGVWRGDFSARILKRAKPAVLHLIDPWKHRAEPSHANAMYGRRAQSEMDEIFWQFQNRFAQEIDSGRVLLHRSTSDAALTRMQDNVLDFIYIDGDHSFEAVARDLELSLAKVRPGGFICVDDHLLGRWWGDGVVRAVNEFLGRHSRKLELRYMHNWQVVIRKREDAI